jgi:hypothetical protein
MNTATMHLDNLSGHPGYTRCYKLSKTAQFGRILAQHVVVNIVPPTAYQAAEVMVLPANELGACLTSTLMRQPGSFVLHADYDGGLPDKVEGAFAWALGSLGYQVGE